MLKKNKQHKDSNSVFEALSRSADFTNELSRNGDFLYRISFFRSLINGHLLHEQILPSLKQLHLTPTLEELKELGVTITEVDDKTPWTDAVADLIAEKTADYADLWKAIQDCAE